MSDFKKWYGSNDNAEKLSKRRKERYKSDPEYRERAKQAAKEYKRKKRAELGGAILREVNGEKIKVWRQSAIAEQAGCSTKLIQHYLMKGVIPEPEIESARRVYTEHEKNVLVEFLTLPEVAKVETSAAKLAELRNYLLARW